MPARGPTFAVIGAAKSASTAVYDHLRDHPDVWFPRKEIGFFDRDAAWAQGRDAYEAEFRDAPDVAAIGDATPAMHVPAVAGRMAALLPDLRLVAVLRDPVDRAWSAWQMQRLKGSEPLTRGFEDALDAAPSYVEGGCYAAHVARFDAAFGREALHLLRQEDLRADLQGALAGICRHIGVAPRTLSSRGDGNRGALPRRAWVPRLLHLAKRGRDALDRTPLRGAVRQPAVDAWTRALRARIAAWNRAEGPLPPCPPEVRARVVQRWAHDVAALEERTGWDLAAWKR
jgi:hypothetical protein